MRCFHLLLFAGLLWGCTCAFATEIKVPAFTAYVDPKPNALRVSERSGITGWTDPALGICWFGRFAQSGTLNCAVALCLPAGVESKLRLAVADHAVERVAKGREEETVVVDFGEFHLPGSGYQRFRLESLNLKGQPAGDIQALVLKGPSATDAHFNLKPRRNAASVHLLYQAKEYTNVQAFYCEVTAVEDPVWTFYMACGWHRGYFGMQVNSVSERRIIFSVWDSGDEAVDRNKVASENRVALVAKGDGVFSGDFGNEGTGGHSHLKYPWKTGEKQRFVVTAKPIDETHTIYSGYYFHPDTKSWMLISSWKAPKEGGYMRGLHSFSENFVGGNGHVLRKALFGNQWIQLATGEWIEITRAGFSHGPTGKADRLDRFMGVENGQHFLSHGGFVNGFTPYGEQFSRAPLGIPPVDLKLPTLPQSP